MINSRLLLPFILLGTSIFAQNQFELKVYELEENATGGEKVVVTKREFVDDKWIKNVKTYPINEYYKD